MDGGRWRFAPGAQVDPRGRASRGDGPRERWGSVVEPVCGGLLPLSMDPSVTCGGGHWDRAKGPPRPLGGHQKLASLQPKPLKGKT